MRYTKISLVDSCTSLAHNPEGWLFFLDLALCYNLTYHNFFLSSERHIPKAQNIEVQYDFPCCLSKIRHPRITKCEKQNSKCRHFSFLLSIIHFPSKIACTTITTFLAPDSISLCSRGGQQIQNITFHFCWHFTRKTCQISFGPPDAREPLTTEVKPVIFMISMNNGTG